LRGEAGWVIADSTEGVPQSMLFRTGGATSVRGYNFESLGVKQNNTVFGARSLIVSSAEYIHWILSDIGIAAFIDAGNAGDDVRSLHPALGYGLGARIKSPVGPFRLDLAYGRDDRTVRLHFSAGVSF
jgi:translocation and assembly module TamA